MLMYNETNVKMIYFTQNCGILCNELHIRNKSLFIPTYSLMSYRFFARINQRHHIKSSGGLVRTWALSGRSAKKVGSVL